MWPAWRERGRPRKRHVWRYGLVSRKIACVEAVPKKRYGHLLNIQAFNLLPERNMYNVYLASDEFLPS